MIEFLKRHKLVSGILVLLIILAAFSYFALDQIRGKDTFVKVERGAIVESIYGIGTIKASREFALRVGVPSVIEKFFVKEGQSVKKGEPLVLLDTKRRYNAPFDGVITQLPAKVGETIFPQAPLLTLTDFSDRYVIVSLEQKGALKAKTGQQAQLSFESIRDQKFSGKVTSVYSNPEGFLVRIDVSDLPHTLLPGMTADVAIAIKTHEDVLLVPIAAINIGKIYVRRTEFELADEKPVQIGLVDGQMAQILSGDVQEGDFVRIAKKE